MQCYCFLSGGLNFLQKDPTKASRSRLYLRKAADSCQHSRTLQPRRRLYPLGRVTGLPFMSLTWIRGRAERHATMLSQRRVKGMYLPEEDPSPLTIGNGIKRKPYPMFPYWQKRNISLPPLLCQLRPFPELTQRSEPAGRHPCLLLIWTDSQVDLRSNKASARSSKQAGGQEQRVRQKWGEKAGSLLFHGGFSTARSIGWNHSLTKSRRNQTVTHVLGMEVVGWRNTVILLPPSLPPVTHCLAMLIRLIHCLRT